MANTRTSHRKGRLLVLIDIENLTGTPSPTTNDVKAAKAALRAAIPDFDDSQRIVSCSHHAAPTVSFAFPTARHLWRSGRDGADLALIDVLENELVHERYDRVIICSGDGIFADIAASLAGADVDVTAIALEGHLSARLELAARNVVLLDSAPTLQVTGSAS